MRQFIICVFTAFLFFGCASSIPTSRQVESVVFDFRPYADRGFRFYSGDCQDPHYQLGQLRVLVIPELIDTRKERSNGGYADGVYDKSAAVYHFAKLSPSDLLDELERQALAMGANGVANVEINFCEPHWIATGTAISIKIDKS